MWVPKYLVSPQDKVIVIMVIHEQNGDMLVYIIPQVKQYVFKFLAMRSLIINCGRNCREGTVVEQYKFKSAVDKWKSLKNRTISIAI